MKQIMQKQRDNKQGVDKYYSTQYKDVYVHSFQQRHYGDSQPFYSVNKFIDGQNFTLIKGVKLLGMIGYQAISTQNKGELKYLIKSISKMEKGHEGLRISGTNTELFDKIKSKL